MGVGYIHRLAPTTDARAGLTSRQGALKEAPRRPPFTGGVLLLASPCCKRADGRRDPPAGAYLVTPECSRSSTHAVAGLRKALPQGKSLHQVPEQATDAGGSALGARRQEGEASGGSGARDAASRSRPKRSRQTSPPTTPRRRKKRNSSIPGHQGASWRRLSAQPSAPRRPQPCADERARTGQKAGSSRTHVCGRLTSPPRVRWPPSQPGGHPWRKYARIIQTYYKNTYYIQYERDPRVLSHPDLNTSTIRHSTTMH